VTPEIFIDHQSQSCKKEYDNQRLFFDMYGENGDEMPNLMARRLWSMQDMLVHIDPTFTQFGATFSYGCNCYMLGMFFGGSQSSPSKGNAVDELDQNCKNYKDCVQSAVDLYGADCIPENHNEA